ncbi:MAG: response regulator [Candidatus Limnocylindrales bacterium]
MTEPIRAVVADDSAVIRSGVVRILEAAGIQVVREARSADELLAAVAEARPDLAVVDIRMPPGGNAGLTAALEIRARYGDAVRVLVLSQYLEPEYAMRLLEGGAGGVGYLLKDRLGEASELAEAALRVAAGGSAIDPSVVDELVRARRTNDRLERLTPREQQILALVAQGRSNRSIADDLGLAAKTVEGAISVISVQARPRGGRSRQPAGAGRPRVPGRRRGLADSEVEELKDQYGRSARQPARERIAVATLAASAAAAASGATASSPSCRPTTSTSARSRSEDEVGPAGRPPSGGGRASRASSRPGSSCSRMCDDQRLRRKSISTAKPDHRAPTASRPCGSPASRSTDWSRTWPMCARTTAGAPMASSSSLGSGSPERVRRLLGERRVRRGEALLEPPTAADRVGPLAADGVAHRDPDRPLLAVRLGVPERLGEAEQEVLPGPSGRPSPGRSGPPRSRARSRRGGRPCAASMPATSSSSPIR